MVVRTYTTWYELKLSPSSYVYTDSNCINRTQRGKFTIDITDEQILLPFREGELYLMYHADLVDDDGNTLIPFHPMITNWYEWCVKEKILIDMMFNSDSDVANKLKFAQSEKIKAYTDAFDFTFTPEYTELQDIQKRKEMNMWKQYFKYIA